MESSSEEEGNLVVKEEALEELTDWEQPARRSAFSPYRSLTVLTNLQRGNMQTHTEQILPNEASIHTQAAMGELSLDDLADQDTEETDATGFTPLMWAAYYGQLPTCRVILQKNARVDAEAEDGETALILAAAEGHHEVVRLLLSYQADVHHVDHMGNSALMFAAYGDYAHAVSELLENGADLTLTNVAGATAYNIAVERRSKQAQIVMERFIMRMLETS